MSTVLVLLLLFFVFTFYAAVLLAVHSHRAFWQFRLWYCKYNHDSYVCMCACVRLRECDKLSVWELISIWILKINGLLAWFIWSNFAIHPIKTLLACPLYTSFSGFWYQTDLMKWLLITNLDSRVTPFFSPSRFLSLSLSHTTVHTTEHSSSNVASNPPTDGAPNTLHR